MKHVLAFIETEPNGFHHIDTERIISDYMAEANTNMVEAILVKVRVPITIGGMYDIVAELRKDHGVNFIIIDTDGLIVPKVRGADLRVNQISVQNELRKIVEQTNVPIYVCSSRFV